MPLCNTANQWLNRWCCKILSHLFVMDCESDELLRHWRSGLLVTFKAGLWNTTFSSLVCRDTPFFGSSIIQKHASEFVSFILTETVSPQDSSSTCGTCTSREEDDTARGKGKCTNWSTPLPCAHFKAAGFLCVFVFVCLFFLSFYFLFSFSSAHTKVMLEHWSHFFLHCVNSVLYCKRFCSRRMDHGCWTNVSWWHHMCWSYCWEIDLFVVCIYWVFHTRGVFIK